MTDPRPRNNQGQFASEQAGGIDAATTSTAYNPQIIEQRRASLLEKIRRMRGAKQVEETVPESPQEQRVLSRFDHRGHRGHGVKEFAAYKPSKEAEALKEATLAYNKFLNDSDDPRAASDSDKGLRLRRNHEVASNLVHQRGIDSMWHLPFGIGKKAKAWRQYNEDVDWVNKHLSAKLRLRELARQGEEKNHVGRAALIAGGALLGGAVGTRTLPRLLPKGRLAQESESLLGKVVYTTQGVTTPAEIIHLPGAGNLRSALRRNARSGGKVSTAALKVDEWLGVPQRHYGVGVGSGRIAEVSKSQGRKVVAQEKFGKTYVDDEGALLKEKILPRRAEGRSGTLNEKEVEAFNNRYESMQNDPRWKRANVCAAGDSNCEAYARGLAKGTPVSRQIQALRAGAGVGALAGGGAVYAVQRKKDLSARLRLRELARQPYDPYAPQQAAPAQPGHAARDFRNAALGVGALGAAGGIAYGGWRAGQAAQSAQTLTDDALKTSAEARKAARSARITAARVGRAGKWTKTQLTTFPTFKNAGQAVARAMKFDARLELKELAAKSE
jgi:hypothetical protein